MENNRGLLQPRPVLTQEVPGPAGNRGKVSLVVQTCNINDT